LNFTEEQVESIAPTPSAFKAGKKLGVSSKWQSSGKSEHAMWGTIKGSGSKPYYTQIDTQSLAYKCTCPSRQFPCKHAVALMLVAANDPQSIVDTDEPEWVSEWINKRKGQQQKSEQKKETPKTPEQIEKAQKNKEKTQVKRLESIQEGAAELEDWISDLFKIGLVELPTKDMAEFAKVQARMVDAKASGLASWVRELSFLDYTKHQEWQDKAMKLLSKLYLLVKAIRNIQHYEPLWQQTIKNLAGLSQSKKELLQDEQAEKIKDHWLVVGQEEEKNNDIITQRNWLYGLTTNRQALLLNFATPFSTYETHLLPSSVIEAELVFFPSIQPYRAIINLQKGTTNSLPKHSALEILSLDQLMTSYRQYLNINPWIREQICVLEACQQLRQGKQHLLVSKGQSALNISPRFSTQKSLNWLSISNNKPVTIFALWQNEEIVPLGMLRDNQYTLF